MFKGVIDSLVNKANNFKKKNFGVKTIANCPRCGNLVIENEGVWGCIGKINGTCDFSMGLDTSNQTKLKEDVNNSQTKTIKENKAQNKNNNVEQNNKNNQYEAKSNSIKNDYQKNNKKQNYNTNISNNTKNNSDIKANNVSDNDDIIFKKGRVLSYKCSCGSDVYRYYKTAKCSNPKCNFEINTEFHGKNFSDSQLGEFLGRRISPVQTFKNDSNGQTFKGRVFIDFDEKLNLLPNYKFVSNINHLSERYKENLFAPDKGNFKGIPLSKIDNNNKKPLQNDNSKKVQNNNNIKSIQNSNQKQTQKTNTSQKNIQQKSISHNPNVSTKANPNVSTKVNPNVSTKVNPNVSTKANPNVSTKVNPNVSTKVNPNVNTRNNKDYDYVNQDVYYQHYYNQDYTQTNTDSSVANDDYNEYLRVNNDSLNDYYNEEANYQYSSSINYDDEPF